ncbi:hypothetical protein PFISCL1PPCAC_17526, partial [Pristionchus fissidentatus]
AGSKDDSIVMEFDKSVHHNSRAIGAGVNTLHMDSVDEEPIGDMETKMEGSPLTEDCKNEGEEAKEERVVSEIDMESGVDNDEDKKEIDNRPMDTYPTPTQLQVCFLCDEITDDFQVFPMDVKERRKFMDNLFLIDDEQRAKVKFLEKNILDDIFCCSVHTVEIVSENTQVFEPYGDLDDLPPYPVIRGYPEGRKSSPLNVICFVCGQFMPIGARFFYSPVDEEKSRAFFGRIELSSLQRAQAEAYFITKGVKVKICKEHLKEDKADKKIKRVRNRDLDSELAELELPCTLLELTKCDSTMSSRFCLSVD